MNIGKIEKSQNNFLKLRKTNFHDFDLKKKKQKKTFDARLSQKFIIDQGDKKDEIHICSFK